SYASHCHRHVLPTALHGFGCLFCTRCEPVAHTWYIGFRYELLACRSRDGQVSAPAARPASPAALSLYRTATFSQVFAGDLVSGATSVGAGIGATEPRARRAEADGCVWFATSGPLYWDDTAPSK